jgi:hypothetical protein
MISPKESKQPRGARRAPQKAYGSREGIVKQSSSEARRRAAAVLEVLAGLRTPAQAATALAVSLPRYYQLELRAIGGLLASCEPAPRGQRRSSDRRVASLEREVARLKQESDRHQALARAAQRTLGLAPPAPPRPDANKGAVSRSRRRRRPSVRALQLAKVLAAGASTGGPSPASAERPRLGPSGVSSPADVQQPTPTSS